MASLKLVEIEMTLTACPTEWEGRLQDGRRVYVRYRHGVLRATAGRTVDDAVSYSATPMSVIISSVIDLPKKEQEAMGEAGMQAWIEQEIAKRRKTIPGGAELLETTVGDDLDGVMDTSVMLGHLRSAGVAVAAGLGG